MPTQEELQSKPENSHIATKLDVIPGAFRGIRLLSKDALVSHMQHCDPRFQTYCLEAQDNQG